jgi:hypothetical protein
VVTVSTAHKADPLWLELYGTSTQQRNEIAQRQAKVNGKDVDEVIIEKFF